MGIDKKTIKNYSKIPVMSIVVPAAIRMADLSAGVNVDPEQFITPVNIVNVINIVAFVIACAITQVAYSELDYKSYKRYIELFSCGII